MSRYQLSPNMRWEILGDEIVGLEPSAGVVYRLTGHNAAIARHLLNREPHAYTTEEEEFIVESLVQCGLMETIDEGISRRSVFRVGTAAVLGLTILSLPNAAAAASTGNGTSGSTQPSAIVQSGPDYLVVSIS